MSFRQEVQKTVGLHAAWRPGKQALRRADAAKVEANPTRKLAGSVYIDVALGALPQYQHANRWDYAVAWRTSTHPEFLHWIEVHSATSTKDLAEIKTKHEWLLEWLSGDGRLLQRGKNKARFVWIASGRSALRANSSKIKQLASEGVYFAGGYYAISDANS